MTIMQFVVLLVVVGICGMLAQVMVGYSRGGLLVSIVLGFVGAVLGTWLARFIGLPDLFTVQIGSQEFPVIWWIIGAVLFVALLSLIQSRRSPRL